MSQAPLTKFQIDEAVAAMKQAGSAAKAAELLKIPESTFRNRFKAVGRPEVQQAKVKILLLDIETSPSLAWVWAIWEQNIPINMIKQNGAVLCWAARWLGEDKTHFGSVQHSTEKEMLYGIHKLVDEADILVHYNGQAFDLKTLNREWLRLGFAPPSPASHVDLMRVCKRNFKFVSNKLDYISQYLGLGKKVKHSGFDMWVGCMNGKAAAWAEMKKYNIQDVELLEQVYYKLAPWIGSQHPSVAAITGVVGCPTCGSEKFQRRGFANTKTLKYPRYKCSGCGTWFRGSRTTTPKLGVGEERHHALSR